MKTIGFDIGTTSISAVVYDAEKEKVVQSYTIANDSFLDSTNAWEKIQDPDRILAKSAGLLDSILKDEPEIRAIGLTGQMHGILYLDTQGNAVSPLYTWQDSRGNLEDAGGMPFVQRLRERYALKAYSGYGLVTCLYQKQNGGYSDAAAKLCTIPDYFARKLTQVTDIPMHTSMAASLGFFDLGKGAFREDILRDAGADLHILSPVTGQLETVGSYRGIPVCVPIGDNQASFLGSVRRAEEELLMNMGTGGQVSVLTKQVLDADDIETRPFIEDSFLNVGASLCGGRAYAILANFFRSCGKMMGLEEIEPYGMMEKLLDSHEGGEPLTVRTTFSGTRDHPELKGCVENIDDGNFTPAALTYGFLNGMVRELYERYRVIESGLGIRRSAILASGNGMRRNSRLQKMTEEVFALPLTLSSETEEAACGAAIAGLISSRKLPWGHFVGI